jgi:hypothetical protein
VHSRGVVFESSVIGPVRERTPRKAQSKRNSEEGARRGSGEAAACSFVSGMTRNSNGTRKVTPARQTVPSAPKFTAVPETVS